MKRIAFIFLAAALTASAANRPITESWDIRNGPNKKMGLSFFQAESVDFTLTAKDGRTPFDLTGSMVVWDIVGWNDYTNMYSSVTGTVVNAVSGICRFELTPQQSNLPEGTYLGYAKALTVDGTNLITRAVLSWQSVKVEWSPAGGGYAVVEPAEPYYTESETDAIVAALQAQVAADLSAETAARAAADDTKIDLNGGNLIPAQIEASGAGSSFINNVYYYNGADQYIYGSIEMNKRPTRWVIENTSGEENREYYAVDSTNNIPPRTGWYVLADGTEPAPTFTYIPEESLSDRLGLDLKQDAASAATDAELAAETSARAAADAAIAADLDEESAIRAATDNQKLDLDGLNMIPQSIHLYGAGSSYVDGIYMQESASSWRLNESAVINKTLSTYVLKYGDTPGDTVVAYESADGITWAVVNGSAPAPDASFTPEETLMKTLGLDLKQDAASAATDAELAAETTARAAVDAAIAADLAAETSARQAADAAKTDLSVFQTLETSVGTISNDLNTAETTLAGHTTEIAAETSARQSGDTAIQQQVDVLNAVTVTRSTMWGVAIDGALVPAGTVFGPLSDGLWSIAADGALVPDGDLSTRYWTFSESEIYQEDNNEL